VRRAPIRLRLTAWYVLVLAAVLAALSAFVVTRLRSDLTSEVDRSLRSAAVQIALGYRAEGPQELRDVARSVLPGPRDHGSGAQLLDPAGRVVLSLGDPVTGTALVDRATLAAAMAGRRVAGSQWRGSPPEHLRTVAIPSGRRGARQVLVVAESLAQVDRSVHRVLVLLVLGGAGALALVGLGGWWIARKALRPVERMTARADRIGIDDLSQRVAVPRTDDELAHLARTLNAMLERLETALQRERDFVADAGHELRTPLALLRTELELALRQGRSEEELREALRASVEEVDRLAQLADDLLLIARYDRGRLPLRVEVVDARSLLDSVVTRFQWRADEASRSLAGEAPPGLTVHGDRLRLEQALGNLVDNALRYGGGSVTMRAASVTQTVELVVEDQGNGFTDGFADRAFERFSRARHDGGGAGLGLAIVRVIAEAHGGSADIAGQSRVRLRLPA
jgi:heavy metal sensor kinase